jgi:serine protease
MRIAATAGALALALMLLVSPAARAQASTATSGEHLERFHALPAKAAKGSHPSRTNNMTYHGGPVETSPVVYISWWGPEWSTGFTTSVFTSGTAQTYITDFFTNVGGSSWDNINAQYCQGVPSGTVNCGGNGSHIANAPNQLAGTWNDTTAVPSQPSQTDIANAALRLAQHFGYSANATYFVFTPTGKSMGGFATSWCAWHSVTTSSAGEVAYAYMPYQPDAGANCGMNFVNGANNGYGNGYFDGFSVVGGHEYAEAETDPHTTNRQYAWEDSRGGEIGDKCAWSSASTNISLGSHSYAVQPLWSNANSGCVTSF